MLLQLTTRKLVFMQTGAAKAILPNVDTCKFFLKEICLYRIFIGFTKMPCYQNVYYQDVLLPKCLLPKCPITETSYYRNVQLPKCPVTEMSVTKTSIAKVSFADMSGYPWQQIKRACSSTRNVVSSVAGLLTIVRDSCR